MILRNLFLQKVSYILTGVCLLATGCHESPYMQGKRLYESHCQSCHMEDGQGLSRMIPSLATSSLLGKREFSCVIILGKKDTIQNQTSFLVQEMPAFQSLTTTELTNLVNYMQHRWQVNFKETTIREMEETVSFCQQKKAEPSDVQIK